MPDFSKQLTSLYVPTNLTWPSSYSSCLMLLGVLFLIIKLEYGLHQLLLCVCASSKKCCICVGGLRDYEIWTTRKSKHKQNSSLIPHAS